MKILMLIALLFSSAVCFAQKNTRLRIAAVDPKAIYNFTYSSTAEMSSNNLVTKYDTAKKWAQNFFNERGRLFLYEDKPNGAIWGRGNLLVYCNVCKKNMYIFKTVFQIDVAKKNYGLRFYDITLTTNHITYTQEQLMSTGTKTINVKDSRLLLECLRSEIKASLEAFQKEMSKE